MSLYGLKKVCAEALPGCMALRTTNRNKVLETANSNRFRSLSDEAVIFSFPWSLSCVQKKRECCSEED